MPPSSFGPVSCLSRDRPHRLPLQPHHVWPHLLPLQRGAPLGPPPSAAAPSPALASQGSRGTRHGCGCPRPSPRIQRWASPRRLSGAHVLSGTCGRVRTRDGASTQHPSTQQPAASSQHPAPCTQHPAHSTQHPAPSTPAPSTQRRSPAGLHAPHRIRT